MFPRLLTPAIFAALLSLAGCQTDDAPQPANNDLTGIWQLTSHQCYCFPSPLPNETVTFLDKDFVIVRNGQVVSSGTYARGQALPRCFSGSIPVATLRLEFSPTLNMASQEPQYTVSGDTLTLDYGGPCDAPVDTYERMTR